MNRSGPFASLNFDVGRHPISPRLLAVGAAFIIFTLLWLVIPHSTLYWLLLPLILALMWAASYGWRPAVAASIQLLRWLLSL